jgi:MFS transporter, MHS family, shikimate and dehydroshikimate transport protein
MSKASRPRAESTGAGAGPSVAPDGGESSLIYESDASQTRRLPSSATRKVLAASAFGTIIEWYDFFAYGTAAALVFGRLFFPASDPTVSTLAALGAYGVGYLARPLGGIVFGHFGDRVGRRAMLVLTMLLMGSGTFVVGLLPAYKQIGIGAPILLVALRLLQAVGLGGEWGGAVLLVFETAPSNRRGLFGSLVQVGNPLGRLVATGVFALTARLPEGAFFSWGWRIPFLASALLVVVGLIIRFQVDETPEFQKLRESKRTAKMPVLEALSKYRCEVLIAVGLKITEVSWVGVLTVFAITYLTQQLGMQRSTVLDALTLATFFGLFIMPLAGWLSDIIGRRAIYLAGTVFGILLAFPIFWLFETRDAAIVTAAIVAGICLCQGIVFALHASFMPELFGTNVRYSGVSLGFQLGAAIGGGLAPVIAAAIVAWSGGATWPVSLMLATLGVLTLIAVLSTRETASRLLRS